MSMYKWLTFDFEHTGARSVTIYIRWVNMSWNNLTYNFYIFLPAVEVLIASVISTYRLISPNCIDHYVRLIIRIARPDTLKIAVSLWNDAVDETGVAADPCNLNNMDHNLLNDPRKMLKNSWLQLWENRSKHI